MDKLQRVLNGNDNSPDAGNPSIMNEVRFCYFIQYDIIYQTRRNTISEWIYNVEGPSRDIILNRLFDSF